MENGNRHEEWYFQSDYDLETASAMFDSGRFVYCIFMCHLSIEKALKGLFVKTKGTFPSKSHSLLFFVEKMELHMDDAYYEFLIHLIRFQCQQGILKICENWFLPIPKNVQNQFYIKRKKFSHG